MANCTVTLNSNVTALPNKVTYEALPNQVIGGVSVSTSPIVATANANAYTATLLQGAWYMIESTDHRFNEPIFKVPASSTADLVDLIRNEQKS